MASTNTKRTGNIAENELYNTPLEALVSFYGQYPEVFNDYDVFYDPCDGLGIIGDFLESIGKKVYRCDIEDYGTGVEIKDFLTTNSIPDDVDCIIFNPPFTLTEKFVDKALELCPSLLMFNRMNTIESNSRGEKFKSKRWPLWNMFQFSFRVSCTKGVDQEKTANAVAYSWFEFDMGTKNPINNKYISCPSLHWITKNDG